MVLIQRKKTPVHKHDVETGDPELEEKQRKEESSSRKLLSRSMLRSKLRSFFTS